MYEIFIFSAVSEISDLDSIDSYKKFRLLQVFESSQEVQLSNKSNFIIY